MKRLIIYPFLLIIAVNLDRAVISAIQIDLSLSLRSLVILLVLIGLIDFVIQYFVRDWHRTNFLVFVMLMLVVAFGGGYRLIKSNFPAQSMPLAVLLIIALCVLYPVITSKQLWYAIREPAQVSRFLNLVFAILLLMKIWDFANGAVKLTIQHSEVKATAISPLTTDINLKSGTRPDIYVIILDGYGRKDVLKDIYGYDNSQFLGELEKRGFYVATKNHSNYVQTTYALASLLNFDYVEPWLPSSDYYQYLAKPIQQNRVYQSLKRIGYTTVSFEGISTYTEIRSSDIYLSAFLPLNKFESQFLVDSPLEVFSNYVNLDLPIPSYRTQRQRILYTFDELQHLTVSMAQPRIVFAHILAPHPPFIFDENGNNIPQQSPYRLWDADFLSNQPDEYWGGYRQQVAFVNNRILKSIDGILENSKTPPIIVLMGDHGPASMFHWDLDAPGCIWERTSNLYALRLPGHQNDGTLYPSISPVNTFRVIFDTYFGTDLPLLEDRTYLASAKYPTTIKDVTEVIETHAGCAAPDRGIGDTH